MTFLWLIIFFLGGSAVGSFINVVADRVPEGKSIVLPPSHCSNCGRKLSIIELFPIFSYLWLRGRCRACGAAIPRRLFFVELGTGLLFAFLYWHYGLWWELVVVALYCSIFITLLVIDLENGILPNRIVYTGMAIALFLALAVGVVSLITSLELKNHTIPTVSSAGIGGVVGFISLLIPALIYRGGMGWGDVKLAAMVGLVTGFPLVLVAMFFAIVSGGLVAAMLLLSKKRSRKDAIPFGPFLSIAAIATILWGMDLLNMLGLS